MLADLDLDSALFELGRTLATTIMELFEGLDTESPLFEDLSLMSPEQFPEYQAALKRIGTKNLRQVKPGDQAIFLDLAFNYIEPRDRLGLLDDALAERLLAARTRFHDMVGDDQSLIAFYRPDRYNAAASVKDNILMGRVAYGIAEADLRVNALVLDVTEELDLKPAIFSAGLSFNIGSAGKRLTASQRQKLALARALLRRPDVLLVHRALSQLDGTAQSEIVGRILALAREAGGGGFGALWNLENPQLGSHFDRTIRLENGRIVADEKPAEAGDEKGVSEREPEPMRISA